MKMELLNIKNNDNIPLGSMRYTDLSYGCESELSSNEESPFFSVGDFTNELHSSFDDISDYILVDESDLKRDRSENTTGSESNVMIASMRVDDKRVGNEKIKKELKSFSYSEESKTCSDNTHNEDGSKKQNFSRTLGTEGRKRMLKLLRRAYKYNDECKIIMKNKNPPLSISFLPYFNLSMLWQLAEDFGVYNEALKIHRECIKKRNASVKLKASAKASANYNLQDITKVSKNSKTEYASDIASNADMNTAEDYDMTNGSINEDGQGKRKRKKISF
ncbi:hypothetical protein PFAG_04722 [Plasmodium falciparum Santa Lucia]|uniref:Uncharacterized protein n=9 Tax=Plasmodium falciparum TaxID=5833 RepID=A0A5K1K8I2_PLAF7|nr:conserved Plasmodium protein, unknown function [Plasmodium falciparum 3D7]ETW34700.1 hypothetical protein PFTANZ_04607 [Plasmodium falciparum Tanzania (2000708)]ETW47430.1 hypothetical protein PFMALIP_04511 [Plasmodium falciparum MaliPS096_E11]ETW55534.1 hypothetical protein PFUGPA_02298 [Plasmodium falciparum Palo Alto/Uganda]ETW59437.1 hypothetical protein PFMC_04625 [Plasmodium falciparum CAMP/Malaysia]EUR65955.1 hypothetical protein PFBG_04697 [Plasmodium falciparum 7G8]EUT80079.1 hypo|eukprot:XP_001350118.1 conserved Plasmodium protein, unknown function [Plasmodium falciparum 3D7]